MAGSISLLHEAVRLEANRERFKALTKYLGALAAVSHALLEICEHGSDALYTSVFEEKMGIVTRCYDRINALFADLTKPDPPATTTIASAGVISASRRASRNSSDSQNTADSQNSNTFSRRSAYSSGPLYENVAANGGATCSSQSTSTSGRPGRRYRQYRTLPNGLITKPTEVNYKKPSSPNRLANAFRFSNRKTNVDRSLSSESVPASPNAIALRPRVEVATTPNSTKMLPSAASTLPSRAKCGPNSNFGTILTTLNSLHPSVFYDVPAAAQGVFERSPYQTLGGEYDSDIEAERELPNLQDIIGADTVRQLSDKERRRQQAIIELFHIERMHVGRLKVMYRVFYKPLSQNQLLSRNFVDLLPLNMLQLLFANIEEILQAHMAINRAMKAILRERRLVAGVGDLMCNFLDKATGDQLKNAAVTFCQYQQYALDMLKTKKKEDKKFSMFLEKAENNPMCRGFPLRDLLPGEMKHLSRYPLLLENILKYTPGRLTILETWEETRKLRHCVKCAKDILHAVNIAKRNFDNARKLCEIRDKLDLNPFYVTDHEIVSAYPNFDLTKYNLIFDGGLKWRIGKKTVDVHTIVLDSVLLLLTISDYDRYRLMFYELRVTGTNGRSKKQSIVKFSPLLELVKVSTRTSPADERAFYLICKVPPYAFTYELVAPSVHERRTWMKTISEQIEVCKRQECLLSPQVRRQLFSTEDESLCQHSHSSSAETAHTVSSGNESHENYYEQIDSTCSSCESDGDSDLFPNIDDYSASHGGIYDPVPPSSDQRTTESVSPAFRRSSAVDDYELPHIGDIPVDNDALIGALCSYERTIVTEMIKRQEVLARIFDLPQEDFSNVADLIVSFRGPKTLTECLLVTMDEVNKLLSLVYWNENSCASNAPGPSSPTCNGGYEQPSALRKRRSSAFGQSNWLQHCLVPRLTPSLLALMRYMSSMLQLVQASTPDVLDCDTIRMKL